MITYLVLDNGSYIECANRLADGGKNKVYYFTPYAKAYPTWDSYAPGLNFEYLEKVMYFFDYVDRADVVINFDVTMNDTIKFIRKMYPNKSVVGSAEAEKLEQDRWKLKRVIDAAGLPVQKSWHIKGITELAKLLKEHKEIFVKLSVFRGEQESFYAKDLESVKEKLKLLDIKFACHEEEIEFVCEEKIGKSVELGMDTIFSGGKFSDKCLLGIEISKSMYLAKSINYSELPKPMLDTANALTPILKKLDFRGFYSDEYKIVSKTKSYYLDICSRLMSPGSTGYVEWFKNFPELVRDIGLNKKVNIDIKYKYMAAIGLETDKALNEYLYIDIDKKDRDKVKFISATCDKKGNYYNVKGCSTAAVLVSNGNTWQEAVSNLKKYRDLVHIEGLNTDILNGIDVMCKKVIDDAKEYNIVF